MLRTAETSRHKPASRYPHTAWSPGRWSSGRPRAPSPAPAPGCLLVITLANIPKHWSHDITSGTSCCGQAASLGPDPLWLLRLLSASTFVMEELCHVHKFSLQYLLYQLGRYSRETLPKHKRHWSPNSTTLLPDVELDSSRGSFDPTEAGGVVPPPPIRDKPNASISARGATSAQGVARPHTNILQSILVEHLQHRVQHQRPHALAGERVLLHSDRGVRRR